MLSPRSVTLYLDEENILQYAIRSNTDIGDYLGSMRILQERTGKAPRAVLDNFMPVFVSSAAGTLTVAPVSGTPHQLDSAYLPVQSTSTESTLFLQRGDHYVLRASADQGAKQVFLFVSYDINPKILLAPTPIVMRNPVDDPIADHDAIRLLQILQSRELAPVEQFFAAFTMPHVWKKYGGGAVPVITKPSARDKQTCELFAQNFTRAEDRFRTFAQAWPDWDPAQPQIEPAAALITTINEDSIAPRPRMRM